MRLLDGIHTNTTKDVERTILDYASGRDYPPSRTSRVHTR